MRNITRTFLRSEATMNRYMADMRLLEEKGIHTNPLRDWKSCLVKEFNHWAIIENKYPYDAIAKVSHILLTKREVPFKWDLLSKEELDEFNEIKSKYLPDNYDLIWENLPSGQTVPVHFHLNVLVLRREQV